MATDKRQFTLRLQPDNFDKIWVIAALNKRSIAMQIDYLVEQCIAAHESKFGVIQLQDLAQQNVIHQHNYNGDNVLSMSR